MNSVIGPSCTLCSVAYLDIDVNCCRLWAVLLFCCKTIYKKVLGKKSETERRKK